jgi:hypothetical protein
MFVMVHASAGMGLVVTGPACSMHHFISLTDSGLRFGGCMKLQKE